MIPDKAWNEASSFSAASDTKGLLLSVDVAVSLICDGLPGIPMPDYVDENVSTKVFRIIQSYVGGGIRWSGGSFNDLFGPIYLL